MNDISTLTADQRKALMAELAKEEKAEKAKRKDNIDTLKQLVDEMLDEVVPECSAFGKQQTSIVNKVFNRCRTIIDLKKEIYGFDEKQASHTFTSRLGNSALVIGYNEIPAFDSTVDVGVQKIHSFLGSLSKDDVNRVKIEKVLSTLTKKNKKGELNPTKVIALSELKGDMDDELFTEGVDIVVASQFKTRTTMYVRGWQRVAGEDGLEIKVVFSITAQ